MRDAQLPVSPPPPQSEIASRDVSTTLVEVRNSGWGKRDEEMEEGGRMRGIEARRISSPSKRLLPGEISDLLARFQKID